MSGLFDDLLVANGMNRSAGDLDVPQQEPLGGAHATIVEAYRGETGSYEKAATARWGVANVRVQKGWKRELTSASRHSRENVLSRLAEGAQFQFIVSAMRDGRLRVGAAKFPHSWMLRRLEEHGYERIGKQGFHGVQIIEVFRKRED